MTNMTMMEEKWLMAFKLLDFNRDGVISSKDRDDCTASFLDVYKPDTDQTKRMSDHLDTFWNTAIFLIETPDWSKSFIAKEFVRTRREMFEKDKDATIKAVRRATEYLCQAADVDGNKSYTFDQFKMFHSAFNLKDENFVSGIFQVIGADENGICSLDSVVEFYTELIMGENMEKHEMCKAAFAAAGMF